MITLGVIVETILYTAVAGTVQSRHRHRSPLNMDLPSHLKCDISRRNPRGSTCCRLRSSALGSRATSVLTGKESGDPTVPAQGILAERQVRCIPPVCGGPGTVRGRQISFCTKVELFGANARQGKETVHLVGNRTSWWDVRAGIDVTGGPDCRRCPRLIQ